ncbi:hypothetical protein LEP1GSC055_0866 [Leptospira borgpetersenii str. Brem 307]|uniref:Lipoprotein n=1 Tax=Leptospira borgpetersenii str. Brem 328 TaxID=1049780 RepID=A0ABC9SMK8_LEPBO|nr:hypothetical protein LEP1GSC055_0866 [Leptospira borgpetersenii str. Brem 307]EMN19055.1 hypothetical protein LEP1GSC056_1904 [Leptospira borgpetersenii str. Brem 328]
MKTKVPKNSPKTGDAIFPPTKIGTKIHACLTSAIRFSTFEFFHFLSFFFRFDRLRM